MDIDVKKLIELLQKAAGSSERTQASQQQEVNDRSAAPLKTDIKDQKTFNDLLEEGKKKYTDIDEKIRIARENKKALIDDEQIILELQQTQTEELKNQFQINQKNLLNLIEQLKVGKEKGTLSEQEQKDLKEKITILKDITFLQGKDLEKIEKEKKLKEGILSIGKEIWQGIMQQTIALDAHIVNISKLNGGYAEHNSKLREANVQIYQATAGSGVMLEEANAALAGLSQNFIGLTTQSQESIKTMATGAAFLTKLGVDAGVASKSMDSLVNAMGKTPQQAYKIQESFVQMAAKNRLALSAVSQAFGENSSRFVGYGEKMTKVLEGLSEQSLKTGVSIGKLVAIAQGFDTFEDASKKVGNLNALLGGDYFNSIELLTASDEDRIKLLKEGVAASGMQFESMNRFQKMAIANAAGITDLNEASKLFGQTSLQNTRQQDESAKVQKTLAEQAESVSTSMDKMKSVINGVVIALDPLIDIFRIVVNGLTWFAKAGGEAGEKLGGWGGKVITVFGSLISLAAILAAKNLLLTGSFGRIGSVIGGATKKLWGWIAGKEAANKIPDAAIQRTTSSKLDSAAAGPTAAAGPGKFTSFINNIKPGNLIAAAGALLLLSLALLALGIALQQFAVFAGMSENKASAIGIAIATIAGLVGISYALNAAKVTISTGVIVLAIMSGSLLLLGIALQSFSKVDWKLVAGVGLIILGLGLAIAGLGMALAAGPQAITLAIGIGVIVTIAAALALLGLALKTIVDAIANASPALSNLANSFKQLFEIKDLKDKFSSIESFLSQLSNIDYDPINKLADSVGTLATNFEKLSSISANPFKQLFEIKDLKDNFSSIESLFSQLSSIDYDPIIKLADSIGMLSTNLEKLASISSNMSIKGSVDATTTENVNLAVQGVAEKTRQISEASAQQKQSLIPVQQTTTFVPLIVQINGKNIIDVLRRDIQIISGEETLRMMDSTGIVRSSDYIQSSPVVIKD
jgi:hypothetical protein